MIERIEIVGVPFDKVSYESVLKEIDKLMHTEGKAYITTPNPEMMLSATENEAFLHVLKGSHIAIPDGIGILWAASYLNKPTTHNWLRQKWQLYTSLAGIVLKPSSVKNVLPFRVTGADMFEKIVEEAQEKKWRIFLLGAQEGVAEQAISKMKEKYPKASFVGCYAGNPEVEFEEGIIGKINKAKPDILFVAYGSPVQESWIHRNLFKLNTVKVALGVGGAFDFAAGKRRRAPKWMQAVGLEWLWRYFNQPKQRHRRIKNATVVFIDLIKEEKLSS